MDRWVAWYSSSSSSSRKGGGGGEASHGAVEATQCSLGDAL